MCGRACTLVCLMLCVYVSKGLKERVNTCVSTLYKRKEGYDAGKASVLGGGFNRILVACSPVYPSIYHRWVCLREPVWSV